MAFTEATVCVYVCMSFWTFLHVEESHTHIFNFCNQDCIICTRVIIYVV